MLALKIHDGDNVATVFSVGVSKGLDVNVKDKRGGAEAVTALGEVPYGHKIAVESIEKGAKVFKYGETIGVAAKDIEKGEHVHVQNMDSTRGRGDLGGEQA